MDQALQMIAVRKDKPMRAYKYIPFAQLRIQYRKRLNWIDGIKTTVVMSPMVVTVVVWLLA